MLRDDLSRCLITGDRSRRVPHRLRYTRQLEQKEVPVPRRDVRSTEPGCEPFLGVGEPAHGGQGIAEHEALRRVVSSRTRRVRWRARARAEPLGKVRRVHDHIEMIEQRPHHLEVIVADLPCRPERRVVENDDLAIVVVADDDPGAQEDALLPHLCPEPVTPGPQRVQGDHLPSTPDQIPAYWAKSCCAWSYCCFVRLAPPARRPEPSSVAIAAAVGSAKCATGVMARFTTTGMPRATLDRRKSSVAPSPPAFVHPSSASVPFAKTRLSCPQSSRTIASAAAADGFRICLL